MKGPRFEYMGLSALVTLVNYVPHVPRASSSKRRAARHGMPRGEEEFQLRIKSEE